jgi:hypothetical protein
VKPPQIEHSLHYEGETAPDGRSVVWHSVVIPHNHPQAAQVQQAVQQHAAQHPDLKHTPGLGGTQHIRGPHGSVNTVLKTLGINPVPKRTMRSPGYDVR